MPAPAVARSPSLRFAPMATDISPPSRGGLPWPAPNEDHQLLELKLEWNGLDDAQERIAAAVRPFLLTRDPLAWIPQRGSAWATANADGDTLELPVYVLYEEAERRLRNAGGEAGGGGPPLVEPVVRVGSASEPLLIAGAYADL